MKLLFSLEQSSKIFPRYTQKLSQSSQYGKKLIEWRKIRSFYGELSQKYLKSLHKKTSFCSQNSTAFFSILESRLDVILYRAYFFESIAAAKQEIRNGTIKVNNVKVVSPSYNLLPGDVISALPRSVLPLSFAKIESDDNAFCERKYSDSSYKNGTFVQDLSPIEKRKERSVYKSESFSSGKPFQKRFKVDGITEGENVYRKKRGWRFQRSPFFLSLISSIFPFRIRKNALTEIYNFKSRLLSPSFLARLTKITFREFTVADEKTPIWVKEKSLSSPSVMVSPMVRATRKIKASDKSTYLSSYLPSKDIAQGEREVNLFFFKKPNDFKEASQLDSDHSAFHKSLNQSENTEFAKSDSSPFALRNSFATRKNVSLKKNEKFQIRDWFFSCWLLFLKKEGTLLRKKALIVSSNKSMRGNGLSTTSQYAEGTRKASRKTISLTKSTKSMEGGGLKGRNEDLSQQKERNQLFFKKLSFLTDKRTKPLHLEISYRSLSIIFLFPPQRIYFPFFINLSQIYK